MSASNATIELTDHEVVRRIRHTMQFMADHINQPLQVATLASIACFSASHYFALFKRQTGHAPMGYFTRLRMQEACRLLETTDAHVKEVAAALGYDDPFYFSRVFKSVNQIAPSEYRAKAQERRGWGTNVELENSPSSSQLRRVA